MNGSRAKNYNRPHPPTVGGYGSGTRFPNSYHPSNFRNPSSGYQLQRRLKKKKTEGVSRLINLPDSHLFCAVCCKPNGNLCLGCRQVAYCSVEHQRYHWEDHKGICNPIAYISGEQTDKNGRKLNACKDMGMGESIIKFVPVMMAPDDKGIFPPPDSILCLGCCKWYQFSQGYRCNVCGWPVCGKACETDSLHAKYECKIFQTMEMVPRRFSEYYDAILALRCLLLMKEDPSSWAELTKWEKICFQRKRTREFELHDDIISNFLVYECHLNDKLNVDYRYVKNFLKLVDSCCLSLNDKVITVSDMYNKSFISATYVFPSKMLISEECTPNTSWTIKHALKLNDCFIRFSTATEVKAGELYTANFSNKNELGAMFRRRHGRSRFQRCCNCRRCTDPTELGSYFSAVRCQTCANVNVGFLLPLDPHDLGTYWECRNTNCRERVPSGHIFNAIATLNQQLVLNESSFSQVWNFILTNERTVLHPNHFLLFKAGSYAVSLCWGTIRNCPLETIQFDFLIKTLSIIEKMSKLLAIICPGHTIERGRLLFYWQAALGLLQARDLTRCIDWSFYGHEYNFYPEAFGLISNLQKEAYEILNREPPGTPEFDMACRVFDVMEDQDVLLNSRTPKHKLEVNAVMILKNIYARFCSEYSIHFYNDVDRELENFVMSHGPIAKCVDNTLHS